VDYSAGGGINQGLIDLRSGSLSLQGLCHNRVQRQLPSQ
jgi:hypothetical protein